MTERCGTYLVTAYRWGWTNAHSYVVYCGPDATVADNMAAMEPCDHNLFPTSQQEITMADTPNAAPWVGKYVVVRCRDAGVHAGILKSYNDRQCELSASRRLWYWKPANKAAFLSGVATEGLDHKVSKVGAPIDVLLTENCEIIACTDQAAQSIAEAPSYVPR